MQIKNSYWEVTITALAGSEAPHFNDPLLMHSAKSNTPGLLDGLADCREHVEIKEWRVDCVSPGVYDLQLEHLDARLWKQRIELGQDVGSTKVNFDVPDMWMNDELEGHYEPAMTYLIRLLIAFEIESIVVMFL